MAAPFRIGFLLVDGFALFAYAAAIDPLREANLLAGRTLYDLRELPADGALATSSSGAQVRASAHVGERVDYDLMLVVASGDPTAFVSRRVTRWLRHLERRGVALGGISGGPVVLARAGLMGGRRMTVHWEHRALLTDIVPAPLVERSRHVVDRDRWTSAGGTSSLDMILSLIERQHGRDFARRVGDRFLHAEVPRAAGPQRSGSVERWGTTSAPLLAALGAMEEHVEDPLELGQLAALAGVGPRQLNRLFHERFGTGAIERYRALRLERAHQLLERTAMPVADVARASGFPNAAHFARRFRTAYGLAPTAVRAARARTSEASRGRA